MPRLPVLKTTELIRALEEAGYQVIRQKGSHVRMKHPDGRVVTVPVHPGQGYRAGPPAQSDPRCGVDAG